MKYDPLEALRTWNPFLPHPVKDESEEISPRMPSEPKADFLRAVSTACRQCKMCELGHRMASRAVGTNSAGEPQLLERDPHVFSNMRHDSRFVVVGQNPGWEELSKGEPFVGAAGKNFDAEIARHGLSRDDFYITNNVKCFTQNNTKPNSKHQDRCSPWLRIELATLKPKLVITLGASAFENFCPDRKFGDCVGTIVDSQTYGVKVYPVYHPSPLNQTNLPEFAKQIALLCKLIRKLRSNHDQSPGNPGAVAEQQERQ